MNSPRQKSSESGPEGLEIDYRVALRQLRAFGQESPQNYSQGLSAAAWTYVSDEESEIPVVETQESPQVSEDSAATEKTEKSVTEKTKVLDSLQDFARKQLSKTEKESISFPGGELRKKDVNSEFLAGAEAMVKDGDEIKALSSSISADFADLKYSLNPSSPLKAMFIAECSEELSELKGKELGLEAFFGPAAASLFDRMIQAMKFGAGEVMVSSCHTLMNGKKESFEKELASEVLHFRPEVVFSLGGAATARLLGSQQRLQNCHGQFFEKQIIGGAKTHQFVVMPLFSPAFLVEAPNSKRIAWEDMQKAMSKLGLN